MEASYRGGPGLPLPGATVHVLQAAGNGPLLGTMAIWMGTIFVLVPISMLAEGHVPDEVLPFLSIPLVVIGLISAIVYHRRAVRGGKWRLHHDGSRMILERTSPALVIDLDDAQLAIGRHEYQVKSSRGAQPTVTVAVMGMAPLIITGPVGFGWENLGERAILAELGGEPGPAPATKTRAPHVRLDDATAFTALQASARQR